MRAFLLPATALCLLTAAQAASPAKPDDNQTTATQIIDAIVSAVPASHDLDANGDAVVDAADIVAAAQLEPTPTPSPNPGDDTERLAAFESIKEIAGNATGSTREQRLHNIADALNDRADLPGAAVSDDGAVWGQFQDGLPFAIVDNRPFGDGTIGEGLGAAPPPLPKAAQIMPGVLPPQTFQNKLPASAQAQIINTLGAGSAASTAVPQIIQRYQDVGYNVAAGGSVASLRGLGNVGIFHIETHGTNSTPLQSAPGLELEEGSGGQLTTFGLWTSTTVDQGSYDQYRDDVDAGRLVPMLIGGTWRWGITPAFVRRYIRFADHGLAVLNACNSDRIAQAFRAAGASKVLAWDGIVPDGAAAWFARYLHFRVLGTPASANLGVAWDPAGEKRPFKLSLVLQELERNEGLTTAAATGESTGATLVEFRTDDPNAFAVAAPSLRNMVLNGVDNQVRLYGIFGNDPGIIDRAIRIGRGGNLFNMRVVSWENQEIVVDLEESGPASFGDVQVSVNGRQSNTARISRWTGNYSATHYVGSDPRYEIGTTRIASVNFRLAPEPFQRVPDGEALFLTDHLQALEMIEPFSLEFSHVSSWPDLPASPSSAVHSIDDSSASLDYQYNGTVGDGNCRTVYSGSGDLALVAIDPTNPPAQEITGYLGIPLAIPTETPSPRPDFVLSIAPSNATGTQTDTCSNESQETTALDGSEAWSHKFANDWSIPARDEDKGDAVVSSNGFNVEHAPESN